MSVKVKDLLTPIEREWIFKKMAKIRTSNRRADEANDKWSRINTELNEYLEAKGISDVVQVAKIKGESLALKDALSTGNWHSRNAERHIHDVNLFLKMKELELI